MPQPAEALTIIVPVYQIREEYLRLCIESLLDQDRKDYRVLMVDDGSPDRCGAICDEYAAKDSRITVIHQENRGVSAARNRAMEAVQTGWLSFVDADDEVHPDYVSTILGTLEGPGEQADILMYDYRRVLRNKVVEDSLGKEPGYLDPGALESVRTAAFYKYLDNGKENPYEVIVLWNKAYRTQFLRDNGIRFVEKARKGQDRLFNADALLSASRIYYTACCLYDYRCLEESRTNRYDPAVPELTKIELRSLRVVLRKHGLEKKAGRYLRYRVSTRLYACMRLYCFHEKNPASTQEKLREAARLAQSPPFAAALRTVDLRLLNPQEKLFVLCVRRKLYRVVCLLVMCKSRMTGSRLG